MQVPKHSSMIRPRSMRVLMLLGGIGISVLGLASMPIEAATGQPPAVNGWVDVSSPAELMYIDENQSVYLGDQIKLMNSIDLSGDTDWQPLGSSTASFSGTFDGQHFLISGLTISSASSSNSGLFGEVTGTIEHLGVSASVSSTGGGSTGSVAGTLKGGILNNVWASGRVHGGNAGGLVGTQTDGRITQSYSSATVSGAYAGGLEAVDTGGTIENSFATGTVEGTTYSGGLVADLQHSAVATDVYATGAVGGGYAGGLFGLVYEASVSNAYFDPATTEQANGVGYASIGGITSTATPVASDFSSWSTSMWSIPATGWPTFGPTGPSIQVSIPATATPKGMTTHVVLSPTTPSAPDGSLLSFGITGSTAHGGIQGYVSQLSTVTVTWPTKTFEGAGVVFWNPMVHSWIPVPSVSESRDTLRFTTRHWSTFALVPATTENMIARIDGNSRIGTAILAAKIAFPNGASTVVLVNAGQGTPSPDALIAEGLSGKFNGPLLLTTAKTLSAGDLDTIQQLGASTVDIVGGAHRIASYLYPLPHFLKFII